jgi:hypothetical protein
MSRLIDADKLIHTLRRDYITGKKTLGQVIDEQPTAFDVDKVVKQLENYLFEKYCIEGDITIDEIVKGGGVE